MRALQELEATGFITRRSQFHDSGAQGSTPYYLNHPQAPHPAPRSDLGRGVPKRDPLNPLLEPPTEPAADATRVLAALPEPWRVGRKDAEIWIPAIEAALASGWTLENLIPHISQNPDGVRSPARVLARRLADLPHPPRAPARQPSRGAANAKTNDHAPSPSPSPCPTAPKQLHSAPAAARKRNERHATHIHT